MAFLPASPARPTSMPEPAWEGPAAVPTKLSPSLLAKLGETFATALSQVQRDLSALGPVAPSQHDAMCRVAARIGALEGLGVRIQAIARMVSGGAAMPVERVCLSRALRETLQAWSPATEVKDIDTSGVEACEVQANAAVLEHLLDLAIESALQTGSHVAITTMRQGQAQGPVLTVRAARTDEGVEQTGDLRWALFAVLARAVGLVPQRVVAGGAVTTTLTFQERDARPAPDASEPVDGLPRTAPASGHRVLLIEPQERARLAAHDLMRASGMRVDSAASVEQARHGLRDGLPDVVVTGFAVDDGPMAALLEEIRDAQPRLRVVQVVDDDDAFAFSAPEAGHPAQVGRSNLASTLVSAVAQELDAAWAT